MGDLKGIEKEGISRKKNNNASFMCCCFLSVGGMIVISINSKENKDQISLSEVEDDLILIQGGTYAMGSPTSEAKRENDEIQNQVQISRFYISPYEVT